MVKVEGVSQQWCDQFGTVVLAKMKNFYDNHPELSLDNFSDDNPVCAIDDQVCCSVAKEHVMKPYVMSEYLNFPAY